MTGEQIPINPEMITWARERAGFSLDEVAASFKKIFAWENVDQETYPTYAQLEKLADKFKVPVAVFFFPEPPTVPPINESFRTLPETQISAIEPRIRILLRRAKAFQISLEELNRGRNPANRLITQELEFNTRTDVGLMAREVRAYLGVTIDEQRSWANTENALKKWRDIFNEVGIFVFKDQFRNETYSGFCLYDDNFPIIYVNNTSAKVRQVFTLFHELAHLLFHTSGIDTDADEFLPHLEDEARRIEIICNQFAAAFLVPETVLESEMIGRDATEQTAREIAKSLHVSWLVIYRKFYDRQWIDRDEYQRALATQTHERTGSGGNFYNNQMAYLGRAYIGIALREYYQDRISEQQLADHLNVAPKNLRGIEERYLKGQAA